jgi:hypothetical protein
VKLGVRIRVRGLSELEIWAIYPETMGRHAQRNFNVSMSLLMEHLFFTRFDNMRFVSFS